MFLNFDLLFFLLVQVTASKHLPSGSFSHLGRALHNMPLHLGPAQLSTHSKLSYEKGRKPTWWLRRPPTFQEACLEDTKGLKSKHLAGGQDLRQPYAGPALCFRELDEVSLQLPVCHACPSTGRTGMGASVMCSVS